MANTKISALPTWSGTAADLSWFVMNNSGETETFKFSGYTSPLKAGTGTDSAVSLNLTPSYAPGANMFVFGNHSAVSSGDESAVLGGKNNKTESAQGAVVGGLSNTAGFRCFVAGGYNNYANGSGSAIVGGENNQMSNPSQGYIIGGSGNYLQGGNDSGCGIVGGLDNKLSFNGTYGMSILGGRGNRWHNFDSRNQDTRGSYGSMIGGYSNRIEGNTADSNGAHAYPLLMGGTLNKIFGQESDDSGTTGATIINSFTSTISKSSYSSIIAGNNNKLNKATNCSIINSKNSSQNSGVTYDTNTVAMIGCENTDITNTKNSVVLGVSGRTISSVADNTTVVENFYIYGNTRYEATTFNNSGTCTIDIFSMSHIIINATGGTYTLTILPAPSTEGTPEITLLINVTGGAAIAFDNAGVTQFRWGNGAGTPTFTNNTKSIIKMASWEGNDMYEISRSMNMA